MLVADSVERKPAVAWLFSTLACDTGLVLTTTAALAVIGSEEGAGESVAAVSVAWYQVWLLYWT